MVGVALSPPPISPTRATVARTSSNRAPDHNRIISTTNNFPCNKNVANDVPTITSRDGCTLRENAVRTITAGTPGRARAHTTYRRRVATLVLPPRPLVVSAMFHKRYCTHRRCSSRRGLCGHCRRPACGGNHRQVGEVIGPRANVSLFVSKWVSGNEAPLLLSLFLILLLIMAMSGHDHGVGRGVAVVILVPVLVIGGSGAIVFGVILAFCVRVVGLD